MLQGKKDSQTNEEVSTVTPTSESTVSPTNTPKVDPTTSSSPATPKTSPNSVAQPTLQKSSGNAPGSTVPSGAIIEFACMGSANANCRVTLQSASGSNMKIELPTKKIADNGRGQYAAIWDWTAVAGKWSIVATSSNESGSSSTSNPQTLEVK